MGYPPSAFGAPPWKGGAASGPAEPDPRRPLGWAVPCVEGGFGLVENCIEGLTA